MNGNEYQQAALRTAGTEDEDSMLLNGVLGLCGETGEVADLVKKTKFQGHWFDSAKVAEELGDVLWYIAVTAHAIGFSLDEIMERNIEKLKARYPDGFDAERSIHRPEYEEGEAYVGN